MDEKRPLEGRSARSLNAPLGFFDGVAEASMVPNKIPFTNYLKKQIFSKVDGANSLWGEKGK